MELSIAARHDSELRALMSNWDDVYGEVLLTSASEVIPDMAAKPYAAVLLRTVTAVYDGLGLYDMTQQSQRERVAEVREFFTAMLTQLDPSSEVRYQEQDLIMTDTNTRPVRARRIHFNYRSSRLSRSVSCSVAARTVLAAGGGCSPVNRHASWRACRWAGTAVPTHVARSVIGPGRWRARSGPLSFAGSCRPSPDCQSETTSPDRGRRGMMPSDRIGSLLLQGFHPVLGTPLTGVRRIHPDHRDPATGRHRRQSGAELLVGIPATVRRNSFPRAPRPIVSRPVARASAKSRFSITTEEQSCRWA